MNDVNSEMTKYYITTHSWCLVAITPILLLPSRVNIIITTTHNLPEPFVSEDALLLLLPVLCRHIPRIGAIAWHVSGCKAV
jgi:hypothetical protein